MRLPALEIRNDYIASESPLRQFRQGAQDQIAQNQRNLLKEVGGLAADGNMDGAANAALRGGDVKTGMGLRDHTFNRKNKLAKMSQDKQLKAFEMIQNGVQRANTPAKYEALIRTVGKTFGPETVAGYETFDKRPSALTAMQQATLAIRQQQAEQMAQLRDLQIQRERRALDTVDKGKLMTVNGNVVRISPDQETATTIYTAPTKPADPIDQMIIDELKGGQSAVSQPPSVMPSADLSSGGVSPVEGISQSAFDGLSVGSLDGATAAPVEAAPAAPTDQASPLAKLNPTQKLQFLLDFKNKSKAAERLDPNSGVDHSGRYKDAKQKADVEKGLRGELEKLSKGYRDVRDAYSRILSSAEEASAAGDLALIFNYMKVLDPGSTVREGEFATAQNSSSWSSRIRAQYNNAINGTRLTNDVRDDFVDRAGRLYKPMLTAQNKLRDTYRGLAKNLGVDPENVLVDFRRIDDLTMSDLTEDQKGTLARAKEAIKEGRNPLGVAKRLRELGIPESLLEAQ